MVMNTNQEENPRKEPQHDLEWQEDNQHKHHYQALEKRDPEKGYSTDPGQGDPGVSYPLRDEDMDRQVQDPVAEAENLKESYEMAHDEGGEQQEVKNEEPVPIADTVMTDRKESADRKE